MFSFCLVIGKERQVQVKIELYRTLNTQLRSLTLLPIRFLRQLVLL